MKREEYLKHMATREQRFGSKSVNNKAFDLVEGGEKINLFEDKIKSINEMDLGELAEAAEILTNYGGLPSGKDIPEELQGEDRRQWYMNNAVNPLTGETLSDYMKDNGLDFHTARRQFSKEVSSLNKNLKEEIRIKTGTKLDLLDLALSDERIGNFLGVNEKMKSRVIERDMSKSEGWSKQSSFAQQQIVQNVRYTKTDGGGDAYHIDDYMKAFGYGSLVGGTGRAPYDKTWKFGFAEEE